MSEDDIVDPILPPQILEARARTLAEAAKTASAVKRAGFVVLRLGQEKYGVPIHHVQEIRPVSHLTRVPSVPSFYAGLVNLRGHLYPVLDLRRYLGLPEKKSGETTICVLITAGGLDVCILADDVPGIEWVAESEIQPLWRDAALGSRDVISGTTTDLLSILDLKALLSDPRLIVQDEGV